MRKALIAIVALVIVGAGGYYGAQLWTQRSAERDVDAFLERWRTSVGAATRGPVEFDLLTRTIKVSNVELLSKLAPQAKVSFAKLVAAGISTAKAERIEVTDWAVTGPLPGQAAAEISYKAPSIVVEGYAGTTMPPRNIEAASALDLFRLALEPLAGTTAASISIPSIAAKITPRRGTTIGATEYTYSRVQLRNLRQGRIEAVSIDGATFSSEMVQPGLGKLRGEIGTISLADFDVNTLVAILDPAKAKDDRYLQIYRQASVGPYTIKYDLGSVRIDGATIEDFSVKPSKVSWPELMALGEATPATMSPARLAEVFSMAANLYEAARIGKLEIGGIDVTTPEGNGRIGAVRFNGFENGRLAAFTLADMDFRNRRNESMQLGRFVLKGFALSNMMRIAARFAAAQGRPPANDQIATLLGALEGLRRTICWCPTRAAGG